VIAHHRVGQDINPHMTEPASQSSTQPFPTLTTFEQTLPTDAPCYQVEDTTTRFRDEFRARTGHVWRMGQEDGLVNKRVSFIGQLLEGASSFIESVLY
jgi:hypothetical protein